MRLLLTRPREDAVRTEAALRARGHDVLLSPLREVEWLDGVALPARAFQAVLLTSANGARALGRRKERGRLAALPCFAVGERTAEAARRAGFAAARSADGAVDDLAALVGRACRPGAGPLLYAAGEERAGDLDGKLRERGFSVETIVLYRVRGAARLSAEAVAAISRGALDGVLLFSRRSASAFAEALAAAGSAPCGLRLFCLSPAVAESLAGVRAARIVVAARPDEAHLLAAVDAEAREPAA